MIIMRYIKNNKNIGLATVTIKGKSFFVGSKTKKFWIHPDKVKSLKVKQKRNITTIRFRKNKGGVTGMGKMIVIITDKI